jgi:hypothetical protein
LIFASQNLQTWYGDRLLSAFILSTHKAVLLKAIDLTDSHNRKFLNCSTRDLVRKDWDLTQKIGVQLNGVCDAIISYSAAAPKGKNLILYETGIRHISILASSIIDDMSDWNKIVTEI